MYDAFMRCERVAHVAMCTCCGWQAHDSVRLLAVPPAPSNLARLTAVCVGSRWKSGLLVTSRNTVSSDVPLV